MLRCRSDSRIQISFIYIRAHRLNVSLQWRHNEHDSLSNHQPQDCLLKLVFGRRSKKTSKLRVTGLCAGNSPGTGEFPAQRASNAENVSIWWRHHVRTHMSHLHFLRIWYRLKLGSRYKYCVVCSASISYLYSTPQFNPVSLCSKI